MIKKELPLGLTKKEHLTEQFNDNHLLKKNKELIKGCRHPVKFLLKSFKKK